jgi:hypothetical protein
VSSEIRTINVTRYVTPLREGGSLPAIIEADDDGLYVLKFRGAGQGLKALVAELLSGEIARHLGLLVPEIVFATLDRELSRLEPDPEIQDLLRASAGSNLAMDFLPGSMTFDPVVETVDAKLASQIVWLDALITNVDRTARNTNMLMWHKKLWLIDHGASLFFHHAWQNWEEQSRRPFTQIKDHVLLSSATEIDEVDDELKARLNGDMIAKIVDLIPDEWLADELQLRSVAEKRMVYKTFLQNRIEQSRVFVEEAQRAREASV